MVINLMCLALWLTGQGYMSLTPVHSDPVGSIQTIVDTILKPDITAEGLIEIVGSVSQTWDSGYTLHPKDAEFSSAFIGVADMKSSKHVPSDIDLTLASETLKYSQLQQRFSPWRKLAASPEGNPFSYGVNFSPKGGSYSAFIVAELSADPNEGKDAFVKRLLIRRDPKNF